MRVTASAPAKINLTLDITGRREDGYHLVHTVMQGLSLRETVTVWEEELPGLRLSAVGGDSLPLDGSNTAWRAAEAFLAATEENARGFGIRIHKKVPVGAGLAGGSADAAATLAALNELTGARLSTEELCELGAKVGADVPFCVLGGTAVGTGIGTILSPLPDMPACYVVLSKPPHGVSTAEAYRRIDALKPLPQSRPAAMEGAVCDGDLTAIGRELFNVFEVAAAPSGVAEIRAVMRAHRALGSRMTGSGSAVFGLFDDKADAERCASALRLRLEETFLCRPDPEGARVEQESGNLGIL